MRSKALIASLIAVLAVVVAEPVIVTPDCPSGQPTGGVYAACTNK